VKWRRPLKKNWELKVISCERYYFEIDYDKISPSGDFPYYIGGRIYSSNVLGLRKV
jgi:hypothetical protein